MGSVGHDAKEYIDDLARHGVDTTQVHFSDLATASFNVLTDSEGNQVGGFYPGAMGDAQSLTFSQFKDQDIIACVSAHDPAAMRRQVQECKDNGIKLFYDPGQQVSNVTGEDLAAGIEVASLLITNDYELGVLGQKIGKTVEEIYSAIPITITTLGKDGSIIHGKDIPEPIQIPIAMPANVVDPTGAGDAYRAGFLYGYLRQWDVRKCGQLGAVVSSFVLEQHGTQTMLDRDAIARRYKETFNEEISL
jgi:adenosine kinase